MKKIIYTLLATTLVFSACKKEDEDPVPTNTTISGCMDNIATNYNLLATVDDGTCIYAGCMDSTALNYNALATVDDGSCVYETRVYVPDDNFEQYLINNGWDNVLDNYVELAVVDTIKKLSLTNKNISDLTGIENFIKLEVLRCDENQLTTLDISTNTKIYLLDCNDNQLTSLNLKNGANFWELSFVDARDNPNLSCIQVDNVAQSQDEVGWGWDIDDHHYFSTNCQ
jgi:Leucine-rich repeat (LRR) protein